MDYSETATKANYELNHPDFMKYFSHSGLTRNAGPPDRPEWKNPLNWRLRYPACKMRKHWNPPRRISSFRNAAGRDGSTSKICGYFWVSPYVLIRICAGLFLDIRMGCKQTCRSFSGDLNILQSLNPAYWHSTICRFLYSHLVFPTEIFNLVGPFFQDLCSGIDAD